MPSLVPLHIWVLRAECSVNLCLNFLNSYKVDAVTQRLGSTTALCANPIPSGTDLFLSCVYKNQKSSGSIENWCNAGEGEEEGKRTICNGLGRTPLAFLALLPRLVTDLLQYRAATSSFSFFFFFGLNSHPLGRKLQDRQNQAFASVKSRCVVFFFSQFKRKYFSCVDGDWHSMS